MVNPRVLTQPYIDLKYTLNRTGPRTDPCGTPNLISITSETLFPYLILWDLPVRKLLNHERTTVPLRPISFSRTSRSNFWSTVSKAAERSRSMTTEADFSSEAIKRSLTIFIHNVSVLWSFLYANWSELFRLCFVRCSFSGLRTTFSMSWPMNVRFDTGL